MDRTAVVTKHVAFVAAVKAAIDSADPIRLLKIGAPDDEYEGEVAAIVPRVIVAADAAEVLRIVHEEFGWWFGVDIAGPVARYEAPAHEIWRAVLAFRHEEGSGCLTS